MNGFLDYLRWAMGWWSSPIAAKRGTGKVAAAIVFVPGERAGRSYAAGNFASTTFIPGAAQAEVES